MYLFDTYSRAKALLNYSGFIGPTCFVDGVGLGGTDSEVLFDGDRASCPVDCRCAAACDTGYCNFKQNRGSQVCRPIGSVSDNNGFCCPRSN